MKRFIYSLISSVTVALSLISCSANATADEPATYVAIKMGGVDLKSAPDVKSETVAQTSMGEIFRLTDSPADGFVKAENIATGEEGYLETLCIFNSNYPLRAPMLAEEEVTEPNLINTTFNENGDVTTGWAFWKNGDGVKALKSVTLTYSDGRMRTIETYYNGIVKDGYLILTETTDYGSDTGEKLDTPIIVWEDITDQAGVFINGQLFATPDAGKGYDTDDWE